MERQQLSISQLAQKLNLPMMTIRRLMSGETSDPRMSTLRQIASFFDLPVHVLFEGNVNTIPIRQDENPQILLPVLNWSLLKNIASVKELDLSTWKNWQSVSMPNQARLSSEAFALESRPSMAPRFPNEVFLLLKL